MAKLIFIKVYFFCIELCVFIIKTDTDRWKETLCNLSYVYTFTGYFFCSVYGVEHTDDLVETHPVNYLKH